MDITLKAVKLRRCNGEFFEYDFYPGRTFEGESHALLYKRESWGNLEYLHHFLEMDQKGIRVIVYCSKNLFPLASLVSHKCVMLDTNVLDSFYSETSGITLHGFDHRKAWRAYRVPRWDISNGHKDVAVGRLGLWRIHDTIETLGQRLCLDTDAVEKFERAKGLFADPLVCVELKRDRYAWHRAELEKLSRRLDYRLVGFDHVFQRTLLTEYGASDCYLSFQILASLLCRAAFVGFGGAGSLFTLALHVNTLFVYDTDMNTPANHVWCKDKFNKATFGVPTHVMPSWAFSTDSASWQWLCVTQSIDNVRRVRPPRVHLSFEQHEQ